MPTVFDPVTNCHISVGLCAVRVGNRQKNRTSSAGSNKPIGAHSEREKNQ